MDLDNEDFADRVIRVRLTIGQVVALRKLATKKERTLSSVLRKILVEALGG